MFTLRWCSSGGAAGSALAVHCTLWLGWASQQPALACSWRHLSPPLHHALAGHGDEGEQRVAGRKVALGRDAQIVQHEMIWRDRCAGAVEIAVSGMRALERHARH